MSAFFAMGGYARYVWPCFGLTLLVIVWNIWAAQRAFQAARSRARRAKAISGDAT